METKKNKEQYKNNVFVKWFLNNRLSIALLNILLLFLILLVFNKISFILNPVWTFFNAILPPLLVASIQFYLMNPIVDFLEKKWHIPRIITIILLFLIVIGLIIWIIAILVPIVQRQTTSLINNWPDYWKEAQKSFNHMIRDPRLSGVRSNINDAIANAQSKLFTTSKDSIDIAVANVTNAVNVITMIVMTLLTAPFVLFIMLKDGHKFKPYLAQFAPQRLQKSFASLLHDINNAIASYIRGQITVAFWVGVMFSIGYSIIGLRYGITLAVLAGFLNLIPYFGTFIALIPALIIGIMTSPLMLLKVIIVFAIEQTIEGRLISPLVMGNKMNMNPVTTILLLIGASAVSGLWGVIFAIPIYAVIKIILVRLFNYYRDISVLYNEKDNSTSDKKSLEE
ncbi:AI-2E family transporter [Lactobacillus rodentium]|uniref:Membrane protein n=1 Tax=Lactobacillus rodentium TaxID=947835 RepID=A0A2Z6TH03_9LACO|nr:AI-2E family transporter [Lactobacillus rodentium]MCR1895091.1 AI-2E family transporter [Lactobacillus rodentium]GBG05372.1 membrane protein [Lactobacillus rodentium]